MVPTAISATSYGMLTDQRTFSPDITATSRVHSLIEIDLTRQEAGSWQHRHDPALVVDTGTSAIICRTPAQPRSPATGDEPADVVVDDRTLSVVVSVDVLDACVAGGPPLRYGGEITVEPRDDETVRVAFEGGIPPFPAFELYAAVDHNAPVAVIQAGVQPGSGPSDVLFGAARYISGSADLLIGCGDCNAGMCCFDAIGAPYCATDEFDLVLSGGPSPSDPIAVDDDLQVRLGSASTESDGPIIDDVDGAATWHQPVTFRARNGDELLVTAQDVFPPCRGLSPLYLHRIPDGAIQVLSPVGVEPACLDEPPGDFATATYRIALPCPAL
jgi:hypothetical protein